MKRVFFCFHTHQDEEGEQKSTIEVIELIHARMRHVGMAISQQEHHMREQQLEAQRHIHIKDRERARQCIVKIRYLSKKRTRYLELSQNLWMMADKLSEQSMYVTLANVLGEGIDTLEKLVQHTDIGKIEEMMDNYAEQASIVDTVGESLSHPSLDNDYDIQAELDTLMAPLSMPDAPTHIPIEKEEKTKREKVFI